MGWWGAERPAVGGQPEDSHSHPCETGCQVRHARAPRHYVTFPHGQVVHTQARLSGSNPGSATCQLPLFPYLKNGYKQHLCGRTLRTLRLPGAQDWAPTPSISGEDVLHQQGPVCPQAGCCHRGPWGHLPEHIWTGQCRHLMGGTNSAHAAPTWGVP